MISESKKARARLAVSRAIADGALVRPSACPRCESATQIVAHHGNYDRPLDVEFMCQRCHVAEHVRLGWGIIGPKGAKQGAPAPEPTGFTLRLAEVRGDLSKSEFARRCGIAVLTYWKYEHGTIGPGVDMLVRIARTAGVRVEWLATGDGARVCRCSETA